MIAHIWYPTCALWSGDLVCTIEMSAASLVGYLLCYRKSLLYWGQTSPIQRETSPVPGKMSLMLGETYKALGTNFSYSW